MMTVPEAAAYLRVGQRLVYNLIERHELKAVHVGRLLRIRECDLEAYVAGEAAVGRTVGRWPWTP